MIHKQLWIKALPGVVFLTLCAALLVNFINDQRIAAQKSAINAYLEVDVHETLKARSSRVAQILSAVYENARMVSLLPGVRGIQAGNRKSDAEDVVANGRFSAHDYDVVQQIYNNLASSVNVSEIYIVLNGFDAKKGEVPFLMLDQLIIGDRKQGAEDEQTKDQDVPEESEEQEYAYFPRQLAQLKTSYPRFAFSKLDQIPMVASPVMRTCDNTQYSSVSKGEVRNAGGILFSVPIYSKAGIIIGLVSVVVRANVFEAAVTGAPYVVVTDEDAVRAKQEQWKIPPVSSLVLRNPDHGVQIFDRRNTLLADRMPNTTSTEPNGPTVTLNAPAGSRWSLNYQVDSAKVEAIVQNASQPFRLPIAVTALAYAILLVGVFFYANIRLFLGRLKILLTTLRNLSAGDFQVDIPYQQIKGEIGDFAQALVKMKSTSTRAFENASVRQTLGAVDAAVQTAATFTEFGNALAKSLHSSMAFDFFALYVLDKQQQILYRSGGFACEDRLHALSFKVGEGLVGQVARDGCRIQLDKDAGHMLHVHTSLLDLPMDNLLIAPIVKSGVVLGVLEVGSIQSLRTVDHVLLNDLLPVLADKIEILQGHVEMRSMLANLSAAKKLLL